MRARSLTRLNYAGFRDDAVGRGLLANYSSTKASGSDA
jgi:hypothetical protein